MSGSDPEVSLGATPGISVCINQFYLPFVTGALEVLANEEYWEDPASVVPEIEKLIDQLNMPAGDCTEAESHYCAAFDFNASAHSDQWTGVTGIHGEDAPAWSDFLNGYFQASQSLSGGASQCCELHAHFVSAITINSADICWVVRSPNGDVTDSLGFYNPSSSVSDESNYHITPLEAPDFNGCATASGTAHTSHDWIFRVQLDTDSGTKHPSGDIVITGINIFGTGPAPDGGAIC